MTEIKGWPHVKADIASAIAQKNSSHNDLNVWSFAKHFGGVHGFNARGW
jgi:hypothetical protein